MKTNSMLSSQPRDLLIADSGPLIALAGVGLLNLLPSLYRRVGVPSAVISELQAAREPDAAVTGLESAEWLEVLEAPRRPLLLAVALGKGEAEALALAREHAGAVLLLDDRAARRAAEALGLNVIGTAGILVRGRREGLVGQIRPILLEMRSNGYFLSDGVISRACEASGEGDA